MINMELWIRSQEKTRLTKVNNILAYKFDDDSYGIQINGECFVGEYKSKERALEVLDEIQSILEQILDPNITILPIFVYEMPKD